jgi:hypothetical protein
MGSVDREEEEKKREGRRYVQEDDKDEESNPQIVLVKWGAVDITAVAYSCVPRDSAQHDPT